MTEAKKYSIKLMVFSAIFYGFCSGIMNIANKFVLKTWSFDFPEVIMTAQLVFVILCLKVLDKCNKIKLVEYNFTSAKSCALLSVFYSTNTCFALFALSGLNLPMYAAIRRCIPLISATLSYFIFSKRQSFRVTLAVVIISIGAVLAAAGDANKDMASYIWGTASTVLMASYLVTLQYTGIRDKMTLSNLLYINSCNCLPFMTLISVRVYKDVLVYPYMTEPLFLLNFFFVIASGGLLNYSVFLCTTVNSALTTTCVGVIKSGFVTVIGMFAFGRVIPTTLFVGGLTVNFLGGVLYASAKYVENKPKEESEQKV